MQSAACEELALLGLEMRGVARGSVLEGSGVKQPFGEWVSVVTCPLWDLVLQKKTFLHGSRSGLVPEARWALLLGALDMCSAQSRPC